MPPSGEDHLSPPDAERRAHTFVVGASAGGVEALRDLVAQLPHGFPGAILVVLHVAPRGTSVLPQILSRAGELRATHAVDGEAIHAGRIYVAPPDRHLLVSDGHLRLDSGPKINGHRPAIDTLFRSAARMYGQGAAGVVLSGVLDDGTAGLLAIKRAGGPTLVQDPVEALYEMMPQSAILYVHPERVGPARDLGAAIAGMAKAPPPESPGSDRLLRDEQYVEVDRGASDDPQPGETTGLTCPDCQGAIWETVEHGLPRYRCRVGHEYAQESFLASQCERVETALWTAPRALEERAALNRRIATRRRERVQTEVALRYELRANDALERALVLRELVGDTLPAALEESDVA